MGGGIFIQILICIAILCCFMFFKDAPLPGGKTPMVYAKHFLEYTADFDGLIARFRGDTVPVSGEIEELPVASPTPSPTPTPQPESEQ